MNACDNSTASMIVNKKIHIPIDIIYLIVRKLKSSRDIAPLLFLNRSWFLVAYNELWRDLSLSKSQNLLSLINLLSGPQSVFSKTRRSTTVSNLRKTKSLDLSSCRWSKWNICIDPSIFIKSFIRYLPNVERLSFPPTKIFNATPLLQCFGSKLSEIDITASLGDRNKSIESMIKDIISFCPNLRKLRLPSVCQDSGIFNSFSLNGLGKLLHLEEISVLHSSNLIHSYSSPLRGLFRSMTNLRKVQLLNLCCSEWQNVLRTLIIHNYNLTAIELSLNHPTIGYSDMILLCLGRHAKALEQFSFKNAEFSDDAIQVLLEECVHLKHLDLEESKQFSNRVFRIFSEYGSGLVSLNLSQSKNLQLHEPLLAMNSVQKLFFKGIPVSVDLFASCPSLESLILD